MDCTSLSIPYEQIGQFSRIVIDYINASPQLQPFYKNPVSVEGIKQAIESRRNFDTDRKLLTEVLKEQYAGINTSKNVEHNIAILLEENTFTFVTAHQPNIFTGYLYLVYKILHIIKLAEFAGREFPECKFVPVFYMGSEDADLEELGKIYMGGQKIVWETDQQGAVGRMDINGLDSIIAQIEGQLNTFPFGPDLIFLLRNCYTAGSDLKTATFKLLNILFQDYGLVVLIPDNAKLKRSMVAVFKDDLLNQAPSAIVERTIGKLSKHYKVQANPREINLFYLRDNIRERIVKAGDQWKVVGKDISFSESEIIQELVDHPDRFSPNVILRGLFQESILPNIAFIGGGGEIAYWLELKDLFEYYNVPFPILILRNSFLFIEKKLSEKIDRLGFTLSDIFREEHLLLEELVKRRSGFQLDLNNEVRDAGNLYTHIADVAVKADSTLENHVKALKARTLKHLHLLEKKMVRAEKRKYEAEGRHIRYIKEKLFPANGLQERFDNFMPYYAKFGRAFIDSIYDHSPTIDQHFVVIAER